jgi:formate hydrogenlyase subunit 3/multisubunit Na+/H+ antiporter MnhD subunit
MLIRGNNNEQAAAAKKSLIMIGASDSLMILGIGLLWLIQPSVSMSTFHIPADSPLALSAFLCLLTGSLTKAVCLPIPYLGA